MKAYKTYAEVDSSGRLVLDRLPFQEGVLLEVLIVDQSRLSDEKVSSWQALMRHVQNLPQSATITDEDIAAEINDVRNTR
jgi:hypothetical protein